MERKRGRPRGTGEYTEEVHAYVTNDDSRLLRVLAALRGCSASALIRALVREEARRRKVE